jgi:hypothetical protein
MSFFSLYTLPSYSRFPSQNLGPTAQILGDILASAKAINPSATVRGMSSDVSNYNGLGTADSPFGYDELVYHRNIAPLLEAVGFPAHFITVSNNFSSLQQLIAPVTHFVKFQDQGRSGRQDIPRGGGDWCNNKV